MNGRLKAALAAAALAIVAACGGGGGGAEGGIGGTGGGGDGGIGGTGVAVGTITDFGSVWVNGIEFDTSKTTFKLDDASVTQNELRRGMVVRVEGSISGKSATTITVDDAVKGFVEQVPSSTSLVVMGQSIQIDAATRFENGNGFAVGDRVDVHGLVAGDGVIAAGYIERKTSAPNPPFIVKGLVKAHDTGARTFQVGSLTVRYSGATTSGLPAGSWVGLALEAKGSTCAATPVCGTLTATRVESVGAAVTTAGAAEYEGIVTSVSGSGFTLGNQSVVTTANTSFVNGTAADITVGTKLEVEGSIANGVLTATRIQMQDAVRLEADVAGVDVSAGSVTLAGLPGVIVVAAPNTQLKGVPSLGALGVANHLRLRGRVGANGNVIATELERRSSSSDSKVELQSSITAFTSGTITLLGLTVNTAGISQFKGVDGGNSNAAAFYAALKVGSVVKLSGTLSGGTVTWNQAELERP